MFDVEFFLFSRPRCPPQQVLYGKYDGTAVDYMGADHQFVRDQDILFVYSGERMQPDTIKMIRDQLLVKVGVAAQHVYEAERPKPASI